MRAMRESIGGSLLLFAVTEVVRPNETSPDVWRTINLDLVRPRRTRRQLRHGPREGDVHGPLHTVSLHLRDAGRLLAYSRTASRRPGGTAAAVHRRELRPEWPPSPAAW